MSGSRRSEKDTIEIMRGLSVRIMNLATTDISTVLKLRQFGNLCLNAWRNKALRRSGREKELNRSVRGPAAGGAFFWPKKDFLPLSHSGSSRI